MGFSFSDLGGVAGGLGGFFLGGPVGGALGSGIGSGLGGSFDSNTNKSTSSTQSSLPAPTKLQKAGENQLFNALNTGYNPYLQNQQFAGQTGNMLSRFLNYGLAGTPEQNSLLEGQTANYLKGLTDLLNQQRQSSMSQAQQSAIARGIPYSDIARGQEANVDAGINRQIAQGYNQAKGQELQNKLNMPMQNIQAMAGLNQGFNAPLQQLLSTIGMSRYNGPYNQTTTQITPLQQQNPLGLLNSLAGSGGMFASGGLFGPASPKPSGTKIFFD